jgi:hypothetical protein
MKRNKTMDSATINVALLRAVQRAILTTPTQFEISEWHRGDVAPFAPDKCSSTACIAGWAVLLHDKERLTQWSSVSIEERTRRLLGLDEEQAKRLFYCGLWPGSFTISIATTRRRWKITKPMRAWPRSASKFLSRAVCKRVMCKHVTGEDDGQCPHAPIWAKSEGKSKLFQPSTICPF